MALAEGVGWAQTHSFMYMDIYMGDRESTSPTTLRLQDESRESYRQKDTEKHCK